MENKQFKYFRFWEKDLVKGYHYYFADCHVDIWANMNNDYMVTHYTIVLHVPNQPELLQVVFCPPENIREYQFHITQASSLAGILEYFDFIKSLNYVPKT